jgi:hypothetical protein
MRLEGNDSFDDKNIIFAENTATCPDKVVTKTTKRTVAL